MGWFGMPGKNKEEAFKELFSQSQYQKKFEMLWEKHIGNRSIAIYRIDGKYAGETILWSESGHELMYKPISWTDSAEYIPKKWIEKLLINATDLEMECYKSFEKRQRLKASIKKGTIIRFDCPIKLPDGSEEDTFMYQSNGNAWAVDLKKMVSGISKDYIISKEFSVMSA